MELSEVRRVAAPGGESVHMATTEPAKLTCCHSGVYAVADATVWKDQLTAKIKLYDAATGEILWVGNTGNARQFSFCPVAHKFYGISGSQISVWNIITGEVNSIDVGACCRSFLVSNSGCNLWIRNPWSESMWSVHGSKLFTKNVVYNEVHFSDDDTRMVARTSDKIYILSTDTGEDMLSFDAVVDSQGMCVCGDLCSPYSYDEVAVWNVCTGRRIFQGTPGFVIGTVCFGIGGASIAVASVGPKHGKQSSQLMCWSLLDESVIFSTSIVGLSSMVLSPHTGRFWFYSSVDRRAHEYDGATGEQVSHSSEFEEPLIRLVASTMGHILL
jgi:hypothetical protein